LRMASKSVKLSSGHSMPLVGLGTWLSKPGEVANAVRIALKNGYRHIDCAQAYENQKEIGEVLHEVFTKGEIKREDVFITSKVWNTFHSHQRALDAVDTILEELRIPYLDLCLIHWPMGYKEGGELFPKKGDKMEYSDVDYLDTWKALEEKVKEQKIRSIGLSNFGIEQIKRVIANGSIRPAVLQVELHPYFQQKDLQKFCASENIVLTAYSPLANPAMPFHKEGDPNVLHDPIISRIAKNHNKTNAQVALRGAIQKGIVVIPKSVNEKRILENFNVWDFELTPEELKEYEKIDQNRRFLDPKSRDGDHPHFPW
jgi:aldehyde reductase